MSTVPVHSCTSVPAAVVPEIATSGESTNDSGDRLPMVALKVSDVARCSWLFQYTVW